MEGKEGGEMEGLRSPHLDTIRLMEGNGGRNSFMFKNNKFFEHWKIRKKNTHLPSLPCPPFLLPSFASNNVIQT